MSGKIITSRYVKPYYDDYNEPNRIDNQSQKEKGYTHLLARPGRVAQAREITQIQSVVKDIIKSVGDSIFKDGDIVEGCQVITKNYRKITIQQQLRNSRDRVKIEGVNNLHEVFSISLGPKTYEEDVDYRVVTEGYDTYIEWLGTESYPTENTPYDVVCHYNYTTRPNNATVTAGKMYMNGMVLPVVETIIDISGDGTEVIGAKLVEYLITEQEDETLRDPATGYDNYNQPGCDRIQSKIEIVKDDQSAVILSTLINGEVAVETYTPEYDTLTQTLARRTYDESGSYIVEGLSVRTESVLESDSNYDEGNNYYVVVEAGKAYVLGYEIGVPTARRLLVSRSTLSSSVTWAGTYSTESDWYTIYSDHMYVQKITSITGTVTTKIALPFTQSSGILTLPRGSGTWDIVSLSQGGRTFTINQDYEPGIDGDNRYFRWTSSESVPSGDITITYKYQHIFEEDIDYRLEESNGGHAVHWLSTGKHPDDQTSFTVIYDQYLGRNDLVYMDMYGNIQVLIGTSSQYNRVVTPEAPMNTLSLAVVKNPPNGDVLVSRLDPSESISVENIGLTRFTMHDIQVLLNRLKTMEYDQAILSLNDEARNDSTSNKRGIFTDPLVDLSHIDFYHKLHIDDEKPVFQMAIDLYSNIAYLPVDTMTTDMMNTTKNYYDFTRSDTKLHNRLLTISPEKDASGKDIERVVQSQTSATKSFPINPYSLFPQLPEVSVSPAVDNWIEDDIIYIPVSLQDSAVVQVDTKTVDTRSKNTINNRNYSSRTTTSTVDTSIGVQTTTSSSDSVIEEQAITYIRSRDITVEGYDFPPSLGRIACYFDGIRMDLHPVSPTIADPNEAGTVMADETGYLKATFTIPAGTVLTGTREVSLKSPITREGYSSEGFTIYIAQGTARTIHRTVTTLTTVLLQRTITNTIKSVYVDPVGQTFVLDRMTLLKGVNLYFESKPNVNTPVICEIREVVNGNITSTVYAHKSLSPNAVSTSSNGTAKTEFRFDDPVLLEENKEYAFVVRSTSDAYSIWVAELGGIDVSTNSVVLKNSYMTGVMLSSSNNSTWTAHQTTDIKFELVEEVYSSMSTAYFENVNPAEFSRVYLSADSATPTGTSVQWYYNLGDGVDRPITPYTQAILEKLHSVISLRADLRRGESNLSPMVALDTISLTTSCYDTRGCYVSNPIPSTAAARYNHVKLLLDVYEPSNDTDDTSISVELSATDHDYTTELYTEEDAVDIVEETPLSHGWRERTYKIGPLKNYESLNYCRLYIRANSTTKSMTPAIRRVRAILYQEVES